MEQAISSDFQKEGKEYAGFWIRFGASIIDSFIIGIPASILYFIGLFSVVPIIESGSSEDSFIAFILLLGIMLLIAVFTMLYYALLHSSKWQGTVGKKLVGIKVIDLDGNRISFWRSLGRYFSMILSAFFYIGYIMAAFTEKKQALHDMIASTLVVKK